MDSCRLARMHRMLWFVLVAFSPMAIGRSQINQTSVGTGRSAANRAGSDQKSHEYYVDCGIAGTDGDGASPTTAWPGIDTVNAHTFSPGDIIRLKRGTECHGALSPKGSGSEAAAIRLSAYGVGARPKVIAGKDDAQAFKLFNQEYWDVDSIDFSGGTVFGVFISGDTGILHHIHLKNLLVHDVNGQALKSKDCGLVVIQPGKAQQHFDDVLVEEVNAYRTNQWAGIMVGGGNFGFLPESDWSTHVTVRNSVVHDVYGDAIVLFRVHDGRIDTSAAWHTGMQPTQTVGTPNAIWTWMCTDCVVTHSEAFLTDSPGVDGGAFDIDYGNTRNSVIDNYGHDTQGYCVSVFGAGYVTHDSVVEGNLCINNGRSPRMAFFQGAMFLWTWNGGSLNGVRVEKNTIYWTPPGNAPALINHAAIEGSRMRFRENQIYSSSPFIFDSDDQISFQNNRYTACELETSKWVFGGHTYDSLGQFRAATGQDQGSTWNSDSAGSTCLKHKDPIATKTGRGPAATNSASNSDPKAPPGWTIQSEILARFDANGFLEASSAGQLTVLKNLYAQFHASGLGMVITLDLHSTKPGEFAPNLVSDLDMGDIKLVVSQESDSTQETTCLKAPDGSIAEQWHGFVGPAKIGLAVRARMGQPSYGQLE